MRRTFTKEQLRDILWGRAGQIHLNEITDHSRWAVHRRFIFSPPGESRFYQTLYSVAATEVQSKEPFDYDEECECYEVEPYQKTVTEYRPVGENS